MTIINSLLIKPSHRNSPDTGFCLLRTSNPCGLKDPTTGEQYRTFPVSVCGVLTVSCLDPVFRSSLEIPEINSMTINPRVSLQASYFDSVYFGSCDLWACHPSIWPDRTTAWLLVQETITSTSWTWNRDSSRFVLFLRVRPRSRSEAL